MYKDKYILSQLMEWVYWYEFEKCVNRYQGNKKVVSLSCYDQFLALIFGQLSNRESLRAIVVCLEAHQEKLYHLGFSGKISRSTLADANEKRDWRIYRDFAQVLIEKARRLYVNDKNFSDELKGACYVLDATVIELCLNIFRWAKLKTVRAAVKMNLQMNLKGNIPVFFTLDKGKKHDVEFLDDIQYESDACYIMDRGYLDFKRLYHVHQLGAFFVIRARNNLAFKRIYSNQVSNQDKQNGIRCDQIIRFTGIHSSKRYPEKLRRVKFFDEKNKKYYVFLTNDFNISAGLVAELYKNRWQIELFFKWIKQHLKIKSFWGRSQNAVKTQICIALCVYLIVVIVKKTLKIDRNIYEILQILSLSLMDKKPLAKLISEAELHNKEEGSQKQASLWDF